MSSNCNKSSHFCGVLLEVSQTHHLVVLNQSLAVGATNARVSRVKSQPCQRCVALMLSPQGETTLCSSSRGRICVEEVSPCSRSCCSSGISQNSPPNIIFFTLLNVFCSAHFPASRSIFSHFASPLRKGRSGIGHRIGRIPVAWGESWRVWWKGRGGWRSWLAAYLA